MVENKNLNELIDEILTTYKPMLDYLKHYDEIHNIPMERLKITVDDFMKTHPKDMELLS